LITEENPGKAQLVMTAVLILSAILINIPWWYHHGTVLKLIIKTIRAPRNSPQRCEYSFLCALFRRKVVVVRKEQNKRLPTSSKETQAKNQGVL
jgi:hypothetical protein